MIIRFIRLIAGLFLYAIAIILMVKAHIGVSPWDVFHQGLSAHLNISFGQASILTGLAILVLDVVLKERIGIGSLLNMVLIGVFYDWIDSTGIVVTPHHLVLQFIMVNAGLLALGFASYLYMSAELGAGPRDSLMVAIVRRTGRSVAIVRNSIEAAALLFGTFLGGQLGFGTLYIVLAVGYYVQFACHICKLDVKKLKHRTLLDEWEWIQRKLSFKS